MILQPVLVEGDECGYGQEGGKECKGEQTANKFKFSTVNIITKTSFLFLYFLGENEVKRRKFYFYHMFIFI